MTQNSNPQQPLVVIGAGVAGLATADELLRRGCGPVVVVERADRPGGLAATDAWEGFPLDQGPHRLLAQFADVQQLQNELLGDTWVATPRHSVLYLNGRWVPYPAGPLALLRALGPAQGLALLLSYAAAQTTHRPGGADDAPQSYRQYIVRRFGPRLYDALFAAFPEKVWGRSGDDIDSDAARLRLASPNLGRTLLDLMARRGNTCARSVACPRHGAGQLAQALGVRIRERGGTILLDTRLVGVSLGPAGVTGVQLEDRQGTVSELPLRLLIASSPVRELVRLLAGAHAPGNTPQPWQHLRDNAAQAAENLTTRAIQLVDLVLNQPRLSPNHWIYFPGRDQHSIRLYEPKNFLPTDLPGERTAVCVEVAASADAPGMPPPEERALADLIACGLIDEQDVLAMRTRRVPDAYPVLGLGYRDALQCVQQALGQLANCYCVGRQGLFSYNNIDLSMKMGLDLAAHIADGGAPAQWYGDTRTAYADYRIID